jgi:hypothetical protein
MMSPLHRTWVLGAAIVLTLTGAVLSRPAAAEGMASIIGQTYLDVDSSRTRSADEPGLANVEVRLTGEGVLLSAITGDDGAYRFDNLRAGSYEVRILIPQGYFLVEDVANEVVAHRSAEEHGPEFPLLPLTGANLVRNGEFEDGDSGWAATSATVAPFEFGHGGARSARVAIACTTPRVQEERSPEPEPPAVSGSFGALVGLVFVDTNGNGIHEPDEPGLSFVPVNLLSEGGDFPNYRTTTDGDGMYRFERVRSHHYRLEVVVPRGFEPVTETSIPIVIHRAAVEHGPEVALRDVSGASDAYCLSYGANDSPDTVRRPRQGERYIAWAWVWADTAVGKRARLRLQELGGATAAVTRESIPVLLTHAWQRVGVSLTVAQPDRTVIDLSISQGNPSEDDAFLLDSVSLSLEALEGAPTPPADLRGAPSIDTVALSWAAAGNADGYLLERKIGETYVQITTLPPDSTTYVEGGLAPLTPYAYRVRAFNDGGTSPYSGEVTGATWPPPGMSFVTNPSFEGGLAGWQGTQATLSREPGGQDGEFSARVTRSCQSGSCAQSYGIDDAPNSVTAPRQGQAFAAVTWVKAAGTPGKQVVLAVRELGGASPESASRSEPVVLSDAWQQVTVTHTVQQPDRARVDVQVIQSGASEGDAFLVDNVSLVGPQRGPEEAATDPA